MNIEFRLHYWPNTPNLRELKILWNKEVIRSSFMTAEELLIFIEDVAKECQKLLEERIK